MYICNCLFGFKLCLEIPSVTHWIWSDFLQKVKISISFLASNPIVFAMKNIHSLNTFKMLLCLHYKNSWKILNLLSTLTLYMGRSYCCKHSNLFDLFFLWKSDWLVFSVAIFNKNQIILVQRYIMKFSQTIREADRKPHL